MIRASGDYLNPSERTFFLANCITPTAGGAPPSNAGAPAPTSPAAAPTSAGVTEGERRYRVQASAQLLVYINRFNTYWLRPSAGLVNDVLELGGIAGAWANQMFQFEPAPPRFSQAHDQMRGALYAFDDWSQLIRFVETQGEFDAWLAQWEVLWFALGRAYDDYLLVVGISLPDLPRD